MKLEIPGQFRGPECRVIPKAAIAIREELAPMFQQVEFGELSTLSLILRVGGSLGEFEPELGDGRPQLEERALICNVVVSNHDWKKRSDAEVRAIVASHLMPAIVACCQYLNLGTEITGRVVQTLAQQAFQADAAAQRGLS